MSAVCCAVSAETVVSNRCLFVAQCWSVCDASRSRFDLVRPIIVLGCWFGVLAGCWGAGVLVVLVRPSVSGIASRCRFRVFSLSSQRPVIAVGNDSMAVSCASIDAVGTASMVAVDLDLQAEILEVSAKGKGNSQP